MTVKERLILYLEKKKITQARFEQSIGASNGYVNSMRKGMGVDKLEQVRLMYPDLNIEWLRTGKGEMFKEQSSAFDVRIGDKNRGILIGKNLTNTTLANPLITEEEYKEEYMSLRLEVELLKKEVEHLRDKLEDKERTIQILLKQNQ